jgi:tetratricopeptide (TPR) repeat protein
MRILLLMLICITAALTTSAQNQQLIQQIKGELAGSQGKTRYTLLTDLAWQYRVAYPDSAINYGKEALALGQKLKLKTGLGRSLNFIGIAYNYRGEPLTAFEYYNLALTVATSQKDATQTAHANNNIGRLFSEQGLVGKSEVFFKTALHIFESIHDSSGLAFAYQSLGTLNKIQNNVDEAEVNFQKAYYLRLALGDTKEIMSALTQIGKLYLDDKQYDRALRYFVLADSTGNIIGDAINLAEIKTLIADCYFNKGLLPQAERIGKEGLDYILKSQNRRLLPAAYLTMGQIYFEKGSFVIAKDYFVKALQVSTARKDLNARMEAHYMLWKTFQKESNPKAEYDNFNQYIILKDSIAQLALAMKEERLKFHLAIEKQAQENELLKASQARKQAIIEKQKLQNFILIVAICSVSIILFLLWRSWKKTQRNNDKLAMQKEKIESMNSLLNIKNATLENHVTTLLNFSRNRHVITGHVVDAAKDIARITAENLQVSRVGVWLFSSERNCLEPLTIYRLQDKSFDTAMPRNVGDIPLYIDGLKHEKIIALTDVAHDNRTQALYLTYLKPSDVQSLLDAAFFIDGKLKGVICCEHQGSQKLWSPEDIIFVASVADIMSLTYRTAQRREHEKQVIQHSREIESLNETLEERVKVRTEALEIQNQQLAEYAFINAHLLRGPLSRILGLINLFEYDQQQKNEKLVELLKLSGRELDSVVQKITDTLQNGTNITREDFSKSE